MAAPTRRWLQIAYTTCLYLFVNMCSVMVEGSIFPVTLLNDTSGDPRCVGLTAALDRLDNIQTHDLERIQNPSGNRMFEVRNVQRITRADGTGVVADRVRLVERIEGIKIRGADVVVNFKGCESGICIQEVESLRGKTFREINVTQGYNVSDTVEAEVVQRLMQVFGAEEAGIGDLSLEVFAATDGDHLAFFTDVLVERKDYMRYFSVIIDAHTLDLLSVCNMVGPSSSEIERNVDVVVQDGTPSKGKRPTPKGLSRHLKGMKSGRLPRYLQEENALTTPLFSVNGVRCGSCSPDSKNVTWSSDHSMCQINSLYLNNTGRETICLVGTNTLGETVLGAGYVPHLYWDGTNDCKSSTTECQTTILPDCSDAISDVQYGAIKTLTYFQHYLGVMGGLKESADNPVPIKANVHYSERYCNAFYRFSANTVFFGDCDCEYWTPLTSIDIVAHEIAHGVTRYSSALEYQYQSGGMNEAFSDIVAAVVECLVNDSKDVPDFDVGEMLGANKLRNMEHPMESRSISSVCDYQSYYDVHHTSGPLNKAFVSSVRSCEQSDCGDKAGCIVLVGSIFMYANVQSLTTYSGYLDGATATCSIVDEYFAAQSPETSCTEASVVTFIREGWSTVNVSLNSNCEAVTCCAEDACSNISTPLGPTPSPTTAAPTETQPTSSPTSVITAPTVAPTVDPVEGGEESFLLIILKFLASVLTLFNGDVSGDDDQEKNLP